MLAAAPGMDSEPSAGAGYNSGTINISDVIEVIETDRNQMEMVRREGPYIRIVEQPASKALRFRYECEGRSAGSIPGVSSTPENKTYPTIQIVGYQGRAVVVVSCVTKDSPYKAHPHNLVGRDGCKKGVCTVEVQNETMTMSFDHLGIQCVKKKDIEEALKVREEIRVDPFRQRFAHRTQPGSIDLNAVRLCFQAFLDDGSGKFKLALSPVVSDTIYDKKALCDLAICKLSHCSASVAGGQEVILLCEKVAKEDISVRFFEADRSGRVTWEGQGDFTPAQVHKQVAISFKTPKYKKIEVDAPVKVFIQLRRPSDGETSDPLPFLLTPLDSGRPAFWSLRRYRADYRTFSSILSSDNELLTKSKPAQDTNNNSGGYSILQRKEVLKTTAEDETSQNPTADKSIPAETEMVVDTLPVVSFTPEIDLTDDSNLIVENSKKFDGSIGLVDNGINQGLDDLIDQIGDFDDIISTGTCMDNDVPVSGNDGVYTSFQMAMKNPFELIDYNTSGYEDVVPPRPSTAKPSTCSQPSATDAEVINDNEETLPPLPPKRIRKSPPSKTLPPVPENKKLNIFQKLFSSKRKEKSRKNSVSSISSKKSLAEDKNVVENVTEPDDVILTEAEHYALYTALAPRATASEFDETSFYYSPVEGHTRIVK